MFSIDVTNLSVGTHRVSAQPAAADLSIDPDVFSNVRVDVTLLVSVGQIVATIAAAADAHFVCDRTLQPFTQELTGSHSVLCGPGEAAPAGDDFDGYVQMETGQTEIDLTDVVRDTILLAVPVRKIAPNAEAAELPLRFGAQPEDADLVDPRWEALRALKGADAPGKQT